MVQLMSSTPALVVDNLRKTYGNGVEALKGVSLTVQLGDFFALLGPNGAGKSTLLKLLAGLARPNYGEIRIFGQAPSDLRGRIAYMGHQTMLYDELTGPENLEYFLGLQRPDLTPAQRKQTVSGALREVALDPANPRRLAEYSQGMRQRASLARVLLSDPDLLLLDEPFSNLDTASIAAMLARLQRYRAQPTDAQHPRTLLLTTHQAELARPLAQQTITLQDGRIAEIPIPSPTQTAIPALPS
jgi:ABC-type multidrug transport system ATPase subunit